MNHVRSTFPSVLRSCDVFMHPEGRHALQVAAKQCALTSQEILRQYQNGDNSDKRLIRSSLLVEEAGECVEAILAGDEVKLLDALADLIYVALGAAVQFDLPIAMAFEEVHRSNMTKSSAMECRDVANANRGKGPGYEPPDLLPILAMWRKIQAPDFGPQKKVDWKAVAAEVADHPDLCSCMACIVLDANREEVPVE